jgi:pimeloyl-ACP methyl ester carboxylesterase
VLRRAVSGDPPLEAYVYLPRTLAPQAPVIAIVHGISELPRQHVECFAPLAERQGAILVAPHFARPRFRDYQRLGRGSRGARADRALERLVEEIARETHARAGRFFLFGYSGGGQFAHRYAMAHPQRAAAAVVASAGWYTFPDAERFYPRGIRDRGDLAGVRFEPDAFLRVPLLVTVGARDVERDASLRQSEALDREQGRSRVERAERWVEAMQAAARERGLPPAAVLRRLEDVGHSFEDNAGRGALAEIAFEHFFGQRRKGV